MLENVFIPVWYISIYSFDEVMNIWYPKPVYPGSSQSWKIYHLKWFFMMYQKMLHGTECSIFVYSVAPFTLLEGKWSVAGIPRYYAKYFSSWNYTRIISCFSDFRVVSRTISCGISESPLHLISLSWKLGVFMLTWSFHENLKLSRKLEAFMKTWSLYGNLEFSWKLEAFMESWSFWANSVFDGANLRFEEEWSNKNGFINSRSVRL